MYGILFIDVMEINVLGKQVTKFIRKKMKVYG